MRGTQGYVTLLQRLTSIAETGVIEQIGINGVFIEVCRGADRPVHEGSDSAERVCRVVWC
jgi:hypothetical protein